MKSILLITLTAIAIANTKTSTIVAQTAQENPQTTQIAPNAVVPLPLLQAAPLVQATSKLLGQQSYQIESTVEIKIDLPNAPITSNAQVRTTMAAPNKVNTEIIFTGEDESLDKTYQIVSNGTQVWIYDVEQNQYSVSEYQQFLESETGLAVGTMANFYLKTLNGVNNNRIASRAIMKLPPDRLLRYFQEFANIDLPNMAIRNEEVEGQAYTVYKIEAADRSYQATTYVTPQSADIKRVDISGKKDGLDLLVVEKIVSQTIPESIAGDAFDFIVPDDAEQLETQIEIKPL